MKDLKIKKTNQVWATDITYYIPMQKGFMYLMAIIDLHSRKVLNWSLSNTMSADWCAEVLKETIKSHGCPEVFNTDQGSQFTSDVFINVLKSNKIKTSMDGKGRALDNIFIERLWKSVNMNMYICTFTKMDYLCTKDLRCILSFITKEDYTNLWITKHPTKYIIKTLLEKRKKIS